MLKELGVAARRSLTARRPPPSESRFTGIIHMDEQDIQDCLWESGVLQSRASLKWIIYIDGQDIQDWVLGVWCFAILGIPKSAPDHPPSQLLVQ